MPVWLEQAILGSVRFPRLGDRPNEKYRRIGSMSRPLIRSGQWSQTNAGISQSAFLLSKKLSVIYRG